MGHPALAFLVALLASLLLSRLARRLLFTFRSQERKAGKEKIHRVYPKARKPLAGGLAILVALTIGCVPLALHRDPLVLVILAATWGFGLIGLADDWGKVHGHGMGDRRKLALQWVVALLVGLHLRFALNYGTAYVPFAGDVDFGIAYALFAALVLVAASNAVNLADGIDGLAGGGVVIASVAFILLAGILPTAGLSSFAAAVIGACGGFLVYNLPPARLLMGDTGALALGAALGGMALWSHTEWLLIPIGGIFVLDAASVLIQTGVIRFLRGPMRFLRHRTTEIFRPFLCTPIHHHFQWLAWPEWRILTLFWGTGVILGALGILAWWSDAFWLAALVIMAVWLTAASLQKFTRANFFLGLQPADHGQSLHLAVFRGLPVEVFGWRLYRCCKETSLTDEMLSALAADSILWRPISEVEASIALGKIYAEHKMYDEAVREWEEVPVRNLLLRENVVLQLGRIYYSQDQLLKAIRLWEQLPESRLERLPNLRRAVHSAKVRLAQLAGKSYQQSLATYHAQRSDQTAVVESLRAALQYNRDLEGLLAHDGQRRRLPGEAADRLQLRAQAQAAVRARLEELELVLDQMAAAGLPIAPAEDRVTQAACRELDITPEELAKALAGAHAGRAAIERMERNPRPSRNTLYRAVLRWEDGASSSLLIKRYDDADITFFSACYRRERRVMELLHRYRCPVPQIFGGIEKEHHALLFLEDIGDDVLAEKLAGAGEAEKLTWLRAAIDSMVMLHSRARWHLSELEYETTQSMKETLSEQYYRDTFRIAVTRALGEQAEQDSAAWMEAARPLVDFLVGQPKTFIHFEFHPQNLLVHREQVHAVDFEQSTLGPPEFDLASLLKCPENDLAPEPIADLIEYYAARVHEVEGLTVTPTAHEVFDYANLFKSMFYAGAAANFHRKFGDPEHLRRRDWYLRDFDRVAARHPALARLRRLLAAARSASPDA